MISLQEAKAQGLKRYFTGLACRNGHIAERYVSIQNCCACLAERAQTPEAKAKKAAYDQTPEAKAKQGRSLLQPLDAYGNSDYKREPLVFNTRTEALAHKAANKNIFF